MASVSRAILGVLDSTFIVEVPATFAGATRQVLLLWSRAAINRACCSRLAGSGGHFPDTWPQADNIMGALARFITFLMSLNAIQRLY